MKTPTLRGDKENNMIGTPSALSVRVSRKLSDENYGSFEVSAELEVNLPADADLEMAFDSADSWLTAAVAVSVREKQANIAKRAHEAAAAVAAAAVPAGNVGITPPAVANTTILPEPTRVPVDDNGTEFEVIEVKNFTVEMTKTGKRIGKVHGGKWTKFGVIAWPEAFAELNIDLDALTLDTAYTLPEGYKHARIEMDGEKPKRTHRFEK
jgi:hypothetical protein